MNSLSAADLFIISRAEMLEARDSFFSSGTEKPDPIPHLGFENPLFSKTTLRFLAFLRREITNLDEHGLGGLQREVPRFMVVENAANPLAASIEAAAELTKDKS